MDRRSAASEQRLRQARGRLPIRGQTHGGIRIEVEIALKGSGRAHHRSPRNATPVEARVQGLGEGESQRSRGRPAGVESNGEKMEPALGVTKRKDYLIGLNRTKVDDRVWVSC